MIELLPPAWVLILAALLIALTRGVVRNAIILIAPLIALVEIWFVPDGVVTTVTFLGYEIQPLEGSPVRRLFATILPVERLRAPFPFR